MRVTEGKKHTWVTLPPDAWLVIDNLKGPKLGNEEAVIIEKIVMAYLRDKGLI